jgi:hypothetical protein
MEHRINSLILLLISKESISKGSRRVYSTVGISTTGRRRRVNQTKNGQFSVFRQIDPLLGIPTYFEMAKESDEMRDDYLPGASSPDYLGRAVSYFNSRPIGDHQAIRNFVHRHAPKFKQVAEVLLSNPRLSFRSPYQ